MTLANGSATAASLGEEYVPLTFSRVQLTPVSFGFTPASPWLTRAAPWASGLGFGLNMTGLDFAPRPAPDVLAQPFTAPSAPTAAEATVSISMLPVPDHASAPAPVALAAPAPVSAPAAAPETPAAEMKVAATEDAASAKVSSDGGPNLFGSVAMPVGRTPEDAKWMRVSARMPGRAGAWAPVLGQARRLDEVGKLALINQWVNHRIAYATPETQYGVADYWATASESLTSGRGNCTAYAVAKIALLREAGIKPGDIYLVLVKDLVRRADHAIVAVRVDQRLVILDSGSDAVLSPAAVRDYRPILTYGYGRTWIHGYHAEPVQHADPVLRLASVSADTPPAILR